MTFDRERSQNSNSEITLNNNHTLNTEKNECEIKLSDGLNINKIDNNKSKNRDTTKNKNTESNLKNN